MSHMGINQGMKVHQFARGFWDHEPPSLTLGCKRLRPLAPKLHPTTAVTATTFDLKSFIRPESSPTETDVRHQIKELTQQVEAQVQPGGTRWNPTQEQIGILEMMYKGGMRTPNAQQIEHITAQLAKYGKIEGKNVFYWFQNHKARERQKQKRNSLGLGLQSPRTQPSPLINTSSLLLPAATKTADGLDEELEINIHKRKCSSWTFDECFQQDKSQCREGNAEGEVEDRTLKLFPLHPEGRDL